MMMIGNQGMFPISFPISREINRLQLRIGVFLEDGDGVELGITLLFVYCIISPSFQQKCVSF